MARRKTNDLENQMSLMDMMASESPEYTEEGPEELLDPGEDMGDSEGQTDKPFKLDHEGKGEHLHAGVECCEGGIC